LVKKNKLSSKSSLSEKITFNIAKSITSHRRFSRFLRILGPGLITGAADDDPSGIATYSQAGASFGYSLLWVFPLVYPLLLSVQSTCAKIGAVTGKGLAAVLKENYNAKLLYFAVALVVVANTINIGTDLGAMAEAAKLIIPAPFILLAVIFTIIVLWLEIAIGYKTYARILKWLAVVLFAYPAVAIIVRQPWGEVIKSTFVPQVKIHFDSFYMILAMLGTTISPYLFFWDTSEVVEDEIVQHRLSKNQTSPRISKRFMRNLKLDNLIGMSLSNLGAWFIVITCASVLFTSGIRDIASAADAAKALEPLVKDFPHAGLLAKSIFSLGIIGLGLLAVPVLAGSSSYAISELFNWREGLHLKFKKAYGFYGVIVLATLIGLMINFLGINPMKALVFTAVFNGIAAVPLLWLITRIGRNSNIMGEFKNSKLSSFFMYVTFIAMVIAIAALGYAFWIER